MAGGWQFWEEGHRGKKVMTHCCNDSQSSSLNLLQLSSLWLEPSIQQHHADVQHHATCAAKDSFHFSSHQVIAGAQVSQDGYLP